ncbi:hypothetical protein IWX90DRAFT_46601 [Phyllosticta citrichinensis]|uniref:Uncharacterized protein n=1 Tax=Phyllosticta citrichinensis TaxID=1130410 RepID=A0ABR1XHY7_9PEZI
MALRHCLISCSCWPLRRSLEFWYSACPHLHPVSIVPKTIPSAAEVGEEANGGLMTVSFRGHRPGVQRLAQEPMIETTEFSQGVGKVPSKLAVTSLNVSRLLASDKVDRQLGSFGFQAFGRQRGRRTLAKDLSPFDAGFCTEDVRRIGAQRSSNRRVGGDTSGVARQVALLRAEKAWSAFRLKMQSHSDLVAKSAVRDLKRGMMDGFDPIMGKTPIDGRRRVLRKRLARAT